MIYNVDYKEQFPPIAKYKEYVAIIDTPTPPKPDDIEAGRVEAVRFYQVCYVEPVPVLEFTVALEPGEAKEGVELKFYDPRATELRYPYVGDLELLQLRFDIIGWARVYIYYPRQAAKMKLKEIVLWYEPGTMPAQREIFIRGDKMKYYLDLRNMVNRYETVKIKTYGWKLQLTEVKTVPPRYTPIWLRGAEVKMEEW